jgi:DNA-binding response OmpR family regulator
LNRKRLASIRHELRTQLNHIIGYTEMLMEDAQEHRSAALMRDLRSIHTAGQHLLTLVSDNLNESAVKAGKVDLRALHTELRSRLTAIIGYSELWQEEASNQGLEILVPDLARIAAAGENLLTLAARVLVPGELDSGPMDGELAPAWSSATPGGGDGVILVVDDDSSNRDMLERRLARIGYTVRQAQDGPMALAAAESGGLDVILLDLLMPGMDGTEVLAALKASPRSRAIPVIMLSAMDSMETIARCIELGAEDYLAKPFEPILLRARIGASLEKKRLRDKEDEYLQQVGKLTAAASAVEEGTYNAADLNEVAARPDPLGNLARVFERMAGEVRAREQRLRRQVESLRVEIDQARKATEVREITDTDFFRDLQSRAKALRARPPRPSPSGRGQ